MNSFLKHLKKFLKSYYKPLLFALFFFAVTAVFIYSTRKTIRGPEFFIIASFLILLLALFVLSFWLHEKKHKELHQIFLIIAPVLGLFYLIIMPLSTPPDELNHFRRAYEISEGFILSDKNEDGIGGRVLPDSITVAMPFVGSYSELPEVIKTSAETTSESFQDFSSASLYSPITYLPEVVGIWFGRILNLPMFFIVYLARFFNLVAYLALIYLALRFIPTGKAIIFLLALSPIALQAAASCQADALINGSIFALFSLVLYKIKNKTPLSKKQTLAFSGLTFLIAMCKIVYLPLCFLVCLIPRECFKSKKDKILKLTAILSGVIILNLLWLLLSSGYLNEFRTGVNSGEQIKYILSNPFGYIITIISSFVSQGVFYFTSAFSGHLGYFNISLPAPLVILFGAFLVYAYLGEDREKLILKLGQKFFIAFLALGCVLLVCTSLYVQWTPVAFPIIDGIQGRYFLPLIPLALLLLTPLASRKNSLSPLYPTIFIVSLNVVALTSYLATYLP